MMGELIWGIIIVSFVIDIIAKQKKKEKAGKQKPKYKQQSAAQSTGMRQTPQKTQAKMEQTMSQKQRELKQRLQQKRQNDILSRATANVRETEKDVLEDAMNTETGKELFNGAHVLADAIDISGNSVLMEELNDLMIMGYQANVSSYRDFVAEGVEMLNRFEISVTVS